MSHAPLPRGPQAGVMLSRTLHGSTTPTHVFHVLQLGPVTIQAGRSQAAIFLKPRRFQKHVSKRKLKGEHVQKLIATTPASC
jgi:hypothetical protein